MVIQGQSARLLVVYQESKLISPENNTMTKICFALTLALLLSGYLSAQNHSGTYDRKDKWGFGQLVITEKTGSKTLIFKLNVGRTGKSYAEYCVGEFEGKAKWVSKNMAEYNGDFNQRDSDGEVIGCRLSFVFSGNTITIRETDCNDYQGAMCNFEGKYSRAAKAKSTKR